MPFIYSDKSVKFLFDHVNQIYYSRLSQKILPTLSIVNEYKRDLILLGMLVTGCNITNTAGLLNFSRASLTVYLRSWDLFSDEERKFCSIIHDKTNTDAHMRTARILLTESIRLKLFSKFHILEGDIL